MKYFRFTFFVIIIFSIANSCISEKEELLEPTSVIDDGIMIKPDDTYEIINNATINNTVLIDSAEYNGKKFPRYEIEVEGVDLDRIRNGTIIIDKNGKGNFYMVTEIFKTTKSANGTQIKWLKVFRPTLDFLFNYEGAILQFSTKENRAKRNSNIIGKLFSQQVNEDESEFESEFESNDYLLKREGEGFNLLFNDAEIKFTSPPDENPVWSVNLDLSGHLNIIPALDFLMEYNPAYFKTSDNEFVSFMQNVGDVLNPVSFFGKSALTLGTLKQLKVISYTNLDYGLSAEFNFQGQIKKGTKKSIKKPIGKFIQVFPIGPVPTTAKTEIFIEFEISAEGEIGGKFYYENENDIVLGFDMTRDASNKKVVKWYKEVDSREKSGASFVVEIELEAGVKLVLKQSFKPCGVVGPSVQGQGYVEGELDFWTSSSSGITNPNWKLSLDAGLKGKATFDVSLFEFKDWELFVSPEKTFAEYNLYTCPSQLSITTGNNQSGVMGQKLSNPITIQVLDSWGNPMPGIMPPVPVFFEGKNLEGYNGTAYKNPAYSNKGISSTEWTLDNIEGKQYLLATLKDEYGAHTGESVKITATATREVVLPTVVTKSATSVGRSSAVLNGDITHSGNASIIEKGFYYSKTNSNPGASDNTIKASGTSAGSYSKTLSGLSSGQKVYYRAWARNSKGTGVSTAVKSFTTSSVSSPSVSTYSVSNVGKTSATFNGYISSTGGSSINSYGFYYSSTDDTPDSGDRKVTLYSGSTGNFLKTVSSLSPNTKYYVRAWASNGYRTGTGSVKSFTTNSDGDIDNVPPGVNDFLSESDIKILENNGMTIYKGLSPPNIEGNYYCDSWKNYENGISYTNYSYRFYNQSSNNSISMSRTGGSTQSNGSGAFIAGSGNQFSVFLEVNEEEDHGTYITKFKTADIYSGEITSSGIKNLKRGFIVLSKENDFDNDYMNVGDYRIVYESDGLANEVNSYPFSAVMKSLQNLYSDMKK